MTLKTAIQTAKNKLEKRAKKDGLWENFGQNEVRKLKDTFINSSDYTDDMNQNRELIRQFDNWCMNYTN